MTLPEGYRCHILVSVDSTNEEARRRVLAGEGHGTVVLAQSQNGGRGRRGRTWVSPPGNLYASVVLSCSGNAGQLAFVAGLAAVEALPADAGSRLKWPNDLLIGGRKSGGILIELESGLAIVGIGINLVSAPSDSEYPATCLAGEGLTPPAPLALLEGFCAALAAWHGIWLESGFPPVREAWLARAEGLGGPVTARLARETVEGRFTGLDADGGLMVETSDGGVRIIAAGDVFFPPGTRHASGH